MPWYLGTGTYLLLLFQEIWVQKSGESFDVSVFKHVSVDNSKKHAKASFCYVSTTRVTQIRGEIAGHKSLRPL